MQLHNLKPTAKNKNRKRVGRGGKRGTYSGRGQKGQKSRAGSSMRADFRGGNSPLWKLFGKQRGAAKKVDIKHRFFKMRRTKPAVLSLSVLDAKFKDGDAVSPKILIRVGVLDKTKNGVKILNNGQLGKKLRFSGVVFSESAKKAVLKAGSTIQ